MKNCRTFFPYPVVFPNGSKYVHYSFIFSPSYTKESTYTFPQFVDICTLSGRGRGNRNPNSACGVFCSSCDVESWVQ